MSDEDVRWVWLILLLLSFGSCHQYVRSKITDWEVQELRQQVNELTESVQ